jgi:hypothetical protein
MKNQLYLSLLLIILFSTNLSAVHTAGTLEKANVENITTVKKKPVKKFFQNVTQRVLENKVVKRLEKKLAKEKNSNGFIFGLLSLIFSVLGLFFIFIELSFGVIVLGAVLGTGGFILGIIGAVRDESKVMVILGIIFGSIPLLVLIAFIVANG